MHQDIKTFSEVLDIKTQGQLQVRLVVIPHGNIHYRVRLNGHLILDKETVYHVDLFSKINLTCMVFDVNGGAVEIQLLELNGQEVLPKYQHLANPATAWVDQKGTWTFDISEPFYPWFHEISGQGWVA